MSIKNCCPWLPCSKAAQGGCGHNCDDWEDCRARRCHGCMGIGGIFSNTSEQTKINLRGLHNEELRKELDELTELVDILKYGILKDDGMYTWNLAIQKDTTLKMEHLLNIMRHRN